MSTRPPGSLRAVRHRAWPGGAAHVLLREHDGRVRLFPAAVAAGLARLAGFRDQAAAAAVFGPGGEAALQQLLAAGWLETADQVVGLLRGRADVAAPADALPIQAVAVPTRAFSPDVLALVGGLAGQGHRVRLVLDDPDPAAATRARRGLGELADAVTVIGAEERAAFVSALGRVSGHPEAAAAALGGRPGRPWGVGALRNLVQLQAVDQGFASLDDDVVLDLRETGADDGPLRLHSGPRPLSAQVHPDRGSAWAGARPGDPVARLGRELGRTALSRLRDHDLDPGNAQPELTDRVAAGEGICLVSAGLAGDSGSGRITGLFGLPDDQLRLLARDDHARLRSRAMLRFTSTACLTDAAFFMSPCFAADGRALLPPFFALHRNTDGLWGLCLQRWVRPGLALHLPVAVRHDPAMPRSFQLDDIAHHAAAPRLSDLLGLHLAGGASPGLSPDDGLAALGHAVGSLAGLPPALLSDRLAVLTRQWLAAVAATLARARSKLDDPQLQAALQAGLQRVEVGLVDPPPPREYAGAGGLDTLRRDLAGFAASVHAWPQLRAAARTLATEGNGLG